MRSHHLPICPSASGEKEKRSGEKGKGRIEELKNRIIGNREALRLQDSKDNGRTCCTCERTSYDMLEA